jgi:hypothetical protein
MMVLAASTGALQALEVVLWAVPGALAWGAARRETQARGAWLLVAAACVFICADKALDLHGAVLGLLRDATRAAAPELRAHGSAQGTRTLLLVLGGLGAGAGLWLLARRLGRGTGAVRLSLAGLSVVVALLAARLTGPGKILEQRPALGIAVQLLGWSLVCAGPLRSRAGGPSTPGDGD